MLNECDARFLEHLSALGLACSAPEPRYVEEPRGRYAGRAGGLVRPNDTAQVAQVLRAAAQHRVGVVPYGGGTGLVGGQIVTEGPAPLLLSLERMTRLREIDPAGKVMICEAGMTLEAARAQAEAAGRLFPLSLASQGSAQIGGLLATNAGGVNVLRYGNARDLCLGVEAVMADGAVFNGLKKLRKDNTGYDLRGPLIGSEGTLGVITAAVLKLVMPPAQTGVALIEVASPEAALALLARAEARMAGGVTAFELIARQGLAFLQATGFSVPMPLGMPDWMVLVELGLPEGLSPEAAFAEIYDPALCGAAVVAQSGAQAQAFWSLRESLPLGNRRIGAISSHDISVPLAALPEFIRRADRALSARGDYRVNCFGHVGDGNLHYNVFPPEGRVAADYAQDRNDIKRLVHDIVDDLGGSVSAEHGVGRLKVEDLERYAEPAKLSLMRAIKSALDPQGILNRGAVLRG